MLEVIAPFDVNELTVARPLEFIEVPKIGPPTKPPVLEVTVPFETNNETVAGPLEFIEVA